MSNNQPRYSRTIKLSPAIGDWTRIADNQPTTSGLRVRSVVSTGFDSLPKEQLELAHYVHYRLGELIVQKLSSSMDIKVELHTVTALQMTYESFIQTYTSDVVQSDIVFPDGNRINVLTDWALADQVVNRLTGGTGESDGSQEFSEIEASILEAQLDELLTLLPIAWKNSWNNAPLNLDFNLGKYKATKKVSPREAYLIFDYSLIVGAGNIQKVTWAYPNDIIRSLLNRYEAENKSIVPKVALAPSTLSRQKIPAKVVLGEAQITMGDLRAMQAGDVIVLNSTLDAPLKLVLGDSTELDVQPGVLDDRLCAQVILWHSAGIPISRPAPAVQAPVSSPQKAEPTFTPVSAPPPAPIQNASPSPTPTAPRTQEPPAMTLPVEVPAAAAAVMVASVPEPVAAVSPTNQADDLDAFGSFEDEHPAQHTEDHDDLFQDSDDFDFENDDDHDASTEASGSDSSATEDDFSFDDHFDNEDTQFGDEFELDETPKQSKSETPVATESDDDFSWDDLDDEL